MKLQKFQITAILYLLALPLWPANSQHLISAIANIEINDSASAIIKIIYRVNKGDLKTIPIKGLAFHGSKISNLEAVLSNSTQKVTISEKNFLLTGLLFIADNLVEDSIMTFMISYDVMIESNKNKPDHIIPILFVDLKPRETRRDFFQATISIPANQVISEAFPTIRMELVSGEEVNKYNFAMQVLPSMIKLHLVNSDNNEFTLFGIIDISVATLILILIWFGWIKLKQSL